MAIVSIRDLKVYNEAFKLAMTIFGVAKSFPAAERYSLTSQVVRSSRSVAANIREGYAKRNYEKIFIGHLLDAIGSAEETRCWLEFALECQYIKPEKFNELDNEYDNLSAMLFRLQQNWKKK